MPDGDDVRRLALALPEVAEHDHHGRPSFRVRGRILATLWPEDGDAVLRLDPAEQAALFALDPRTFEPARWGAVAWTRVHLAHVDPVELGELVQDAWRGVAPRALVRAFDAR